MDSQPNSTEARDKKYVLHAYTNARRHQETGPLIIEKGDGIYVEDSSGNRYIEAMAGLWSVGVGFSEKRLVDAAAAQMAKLPFYQNFYSRSHSPLIDLSEKLVSMAPVPMSKVFLANSGSEANDTAMKMIWYRSNALGQPERKKIISRKRGYHGVTIASASLTGLTYNHASFDLPLANIKHVSAPHHWREGLPGETEEQFSTRLADELEQTILAEGPETVAAFFGEPVMGAGGVVVPPAGYWEKIQAVLKKYDILLVADEVICGFGRTGEMFGSQTYNIKPDIMVLSKQLSSSYMPIAALLVNDKVFEPLADESNRIGTFGHGFTGGGHPVAAAVALENICIIEERKLVDNAREVGAHMQKRAHALSSHKLFGEARGVGLIGAVELVMDKASKAPLEGTLGKLGAVVNGLLQQNGVLSRNLGDAISFCPPLIITEKQVDQMFDMFEKSLDEAARQLKV